MILYQIVNQQDSMKGNHQLSMDDFSSKNTEVQIENSQGNGWWSLKSKVNSKYNLCIVILFFTLLIGLFIFTAIYLDRITKKLQRQQVQNQQILGLLQKTRKQNEKISAKTRQISVPKRNFKQPSSEDFSHFYCPKGIMEKNKLPPQGQREFLINTKHGFQIYGDASRGRKAQYMTDMIMDQGTFEPENINLMGRLLRPGYKMLNLGAHAGLEAMVSASIIGDQGHIYVFQPSNFSNMLVTKGFEHNNLTNRASIFKVALSDVKKKSKLYINMGNTGANTIQQNAVEMKTWPGVTYEQIQLDLVDNIIPQDVQIDFALVDVERHQVEAFTGMRKVIERSPYLVIMVQWAYGLNQRKNPKKARQVIHFFLEQGYTFYSFSGFEPYRCITGTYKPFNDPLNQLLQIEMQNLLIAPSTVILP